jgi:hypothetical protein
MGIRGELFSTRMTCEGRTYFFNVKQNRMGDVFLTIVESKPTEAETFDRRSIVVFRDDMRVFLKAFQGALKYMEKPGVEPGTVTFSPADAAPASSRPRSAGPKKEATGEAPAKKRRVVIRRKPQLSKDDGQQAED